MQAILSSAVTPTTPLPPPTLPSVLVADSSGSVRSSCARIAIDMGFGVLEAADAASLRTTLRRSPPGLLLLDLEIPGGGLPLLAETRRLHPQVRVVVMTEFATVETAVEAMRLGAGDFLPKPFSVEELATILSRSASRRDSTLQGNLLHQQLHTATGLDEIIGRAPEMEKLYRILSKVAFTTNPVLILGESGTGKELFARSIHFNGPHASRPFHLLDCASTPAETLERQLFGSHPSSLSGATGLLSSDEGGTVLLDEVANLPPELQARLLRVLQDKEVRTTGSIETRPLTVRLLAATSRNLQALVDSGRFRKDLFYRLNVVNLRIPPLRDRPTDIALLAHHFLDRLEREAGATLTLSDETLRLMEAYDWPGNVRELETAMERACALNSGPVLHLNDLPTQLQDFRHQRAAAQAAKPAPAPVNTDPGIAAGGVILPMAEVERQVILKTLRQLDGDKLKAARLLGIGKTTLYRKLKEYGIGDGDPLPAA